MRCSLQGRLHDEDKLRHHESGGCDASMFHINSLCPVERRRDRIAAGAASLADLLKGLSALQPDFDRLPASYFLRVKRAQVGEMERKRDSACVRR